MQFSQESVIIPPSFIQQVARSSAQLTLKMTDNNKKRAAQILGISLRTLHNRMAEFAAEDAATDAVLSRSAVPTP
jgi:DNA-binding NtrC family response regulator